VGAALNGRGRIASAIAVLTLSSLAACSLVTDLTGLSGSDVGDGGASGPGDAGASDAAATDGPGIFADDAGTYASLVLADDPLAYYRLDEPSGIVAHDATGHGNTAGMGTGHTFGVSGALAGDPDTALHLDGLNSGINAGRTFDFTARSPYSLEAWTRVDLVDSTYRHVFKKSAFRATGREAYGIFVHDGDLTFERWVAGEQRLVGGPTAPIMNRWAHLVATYDGTSLRMYVDGVEIDSTEDTRAARSIDADAVIGCNEALDTGVLAGDLDEVAVYGKALTADRIKKHFDTGKGTH
jgi:hypothetical protein